MKLSFIIPAWNEELLLGATIQALQQATGNYDYEIIVVDDASDDGTSRIAKELGTKVVSSNNRQIGLTRNDGAAVATGDLFIFVDADTIVSEQVVRETVEAIENGAVAGGSFPVFDGNVPLVAKVMTPMLRLIFRLLRCSRSLFSRSRIRKKQ